MKRPQAPEIFQKPVAAIDLAGLPPRDAPDFDQAVITRYALEYANKGWNAIVTVDSEFVRVVAVPENGIGPKQYVSSLLRHRHLEDALPILEALYGMLDDAEIAYNYGICLSKLGRIEESVLPLQRCVELDSEYTSAYVGLGIAFTRLGRSEDAERVLHAAIRQDISSHKRMEAKLAENQRRLSESESRYRNLYVNNPLMYFTVDAAGIVASVNPQGATQLGYGVDELVGRPVTTVFPSDLHTQVYTQLNQCLREPERVHTWEITKLRKDGETIWVRETAVAVRDGNQAPLLLIMCENATERRRAELALRDSEQRMRTLLDAIPDHVRLKDASGRYIMVNRAAQESFGLPEQQIIGKTVFDLRPAAAAAVIDAEDSQAMGAPMPMRIERRSFMEQGIWREEILAPIRDSGGVVTGLVSISRDITERKQAELQALREREERYRTLVEQASDIIYRTDLKGFFTYLNTDAAARMLGYSREDLLGHHYLEFVHPDYRAETENFYRREFRERRPSSYYEFPAIAKDGRIVWVGQHVQSIFENNRIVYHQAVCRNITKRVAAQQALRESNDKLRQISARQEGLLETERTRIAHDLHDGIGQSLNLARIKIADVRSQPGVGPFEGQLREVTQIIDQAGSVIRTLEFDLSLPVLRELGLAPALEWLADEMHREYGLQVGVSDDGEPKPLDQLSRAIVFRAVRELLINVVRHAGVTRSYVDTQRATDMLIVTVSDEGAGFDAAVAARGLGLVSVRERLAYIGGNVAVASVPGEGTVTTLSVPLVAGNTDGKAT